MVLEKNIEADGAVAVGRIRLFPGEPLTNLATGTNAAYRAEMGDKSKGEFFGLICDPLSLPRLDIMPSASKANAPSLLSPLEWQVAFWPVTRRRHLVVAFERPAGGRLVATLDQTIPPVGEEEIIRRYLPAFVAALRALHEVGVVHGGINPTTIFFRDAQHRQPVLGECVSTGMALRQPAAFSPIETALAAPMARGSGQAGDDVFSLGVTLAFLLLGRNPAAGRDPKELMRQRIDSGSYGAIIGNHRIPVGMIELLRGLLADDPKVRWTVAEIEEWLPARRAVTRQSAAVKRASRPFDFDGHSYTNARALAQAFAANIPAAAPVARTRDFAIWVQRALVDDASHALIKLTHDESGLPDDLVVCHICVALDYHAPIRFRELATTIDGFGGALATAFMDAGDLQTMAAAIRLRLPQFWLGARKPPAAEHVQLAKQFERLRPMVDDRRMGAGMERILYELNPYLHCLSPVVETDYVCSLRELLPALERRAADKFGGSQPLDRHSVAFVSAKMKTAANEWMDLLSSAEPQRRLIGSARLLARVQNQCGPASLPLLAKWIAQQGTAIVDSYHHRPTRKRLAAELSRAAEAGKLVDLLIMLDDDEGGQSDMRGFAEAKRAYETVQREIQRLGTDKDRNERIIARLAGQVAASMGTICSAAGILAACLILS